MMSLSVTPLAHTAEDSDVSSPVGSSLLRIRRARAFAAIKRHEGSTVTGIQNSHADQEINSSCLQNEDGITKHSGNDDGLPQCALDALCVCCEETMIISHVKATREGLDQAMLSELSISSCVQSNSDEEGEERLVRVRRCRAFNGHQAATELAEAEVENHWQCADTLEGISQASLDAMCVLEDSISPTAASPDSVLHRMRRIRAYLGADQAQAFSASEQHRFDLVPVSEPAGISQASLDEFCGNVSRGQQEDATINEDDKTSMHSSESLLLRSRRIRAFLGHEEAAQFAASMRRSTSEASDDDAGSTSNSRDSSVCGSPESTGSMLLRIRRARAFAGHERALALSEEFIAATDSRSASVVSPSIVVRQALFSDENTTMVMHEATSTTCSTKSSLCEEDHCTTKAVCGTKSAILADIEVDTTAGFDMHLSSPTRKLRVMRGGA